MDPRLGLREKALCRVVSSAHNMHFLSDLPSMGAGCDQAPHPCLAQRVSCRSGRSGAVLVKGRVRMWDKRVECLSMISGASQPIFFKIS